MTPEHREKLRQAALRQNNCPKCGGSSVRQVDGADCDGLPGIKYRVCNGCGRAWPITRRSRKSEL